MIENVKRLQPHDDPLVMMGIVANLALRNPRAYPWCTAIMSHILSFCTLDSRAALIKDIHKKFDDIPNTGLLDIWLQRISYTLVPDLSFKERLAKIASGELTENTIWNSSWLRSGLNEVVTNTNILNREQLELMPTTVPKEEVALFRLPIFS